MHELRGTALAIAGVIVVFTASMATLFLVFGWTAFSVYAIVKLTTGGSDEPNAAGFLVAMVLIVTTIVVLLAGTIKLIGKAMEPAKRRDAEFEAPGL